MGISSNLEVFLSEKHRDHEFITTTTTSTALLTTNPAMEEETNDQEQSHHASTEQDLDDDLIKTKQQAVRVQEPKNNDHGDNNNVPVVLLPSASPDLCLKIKIPPYNVEEEETEKEGSSSSNDDGLKTPTGPEHRIPPTLECPPAPRKHRTTPSSTAKRKGCYCHRSCVPLIGFSQEVFDDSFFPKTPSTVDRGAITSCSSKKNKKVKVKLFTDDDEEKEESLQ